MESITLLNQLNNPVEILNIVRKLPMFLQHKWKQRTFEIYKKDEQVAFIHFVEFMEAQSEYVSVPIFDEIGYKYKDAKKEMNKEKQIKVKLSLHSRKTNLQRRFKQIVIKDIKVIPN